MAPESRRGDVVVVSIPGEFGKPRPAVVVQSDLLTGRSEGVIVCPITSRSTPGVMVRPALSPTEENGLKLASQVMADKITTVHLSRIGSRIGRVAASDLRDIELSLGLVLGLLDPKQGHVPPL